MLKAFGKFIWLFIYNILEGICKFIYLMLPLGVHMFALQMREQINPVTTLTTFIDENSTWTMAYDGLVMVNTNVGAVRKKIKNFKAWCKKWTWLFITISVVAIISLLVIIAFKVI